jgi:hypothetical protein
MRLLWLLVPFLFAVEPPVFFRGQGAGFKKIFDGKSLKGWKGDSTIWRVEAGAIVGEIKPDQVLKRNTFLVWTGGQPADFELKCLFRISDKGNSGINYRSTLLSPEFPFALRGYQADIDGAAQYTGQLYEEKARSTLAYRGEAVRVHEQSDPELKNNLSSRSKNNAWLDRTVTGSLGAAETLRSTIKNSDWNELHLVIRENRLQHYVNGVLMADVIDQDVVNGKKAGLLGLQVHVGPPMKVEFKDIRLKTIQ